MTVTPAEAAPDTEALSPTVAGRNFPTNGGGLCHKGWTSAAVLNAPDRLTTPLVRRSGTLVPASWDEALANISEKLLKLRESHGPDAVAVFGGGGLTNEKAYTLGKFARIALGTKYIDYNGRFCMSAAAAAGNRAFGIDRGLPFPLTDLAKADAILLLGSNLADTMPPAVQHLGPVRERGGLIVTDPRRSATAALTAEGAGTHLQLLPGTDLALLLGVLHLLIAEGRIDRDYLAHRCTDFGVIQKSVSTWWPERTEQVTGVPAPTLRRIARQLAAASPTFGGRGCFILTGRGAEQHAQGVATVTAAINLALALGLPGRTGSGYGCITGQGNGQGGREHGQKSDQLPGYRRIDDPAARTHVAAVWGVPESAIPGPGVPAVELLRRLGTFAGPRALLVHGSNLLVSSPNADKVRERLAALELLIVCDFVLSETAAVADVVLPVTQWAEEEGTMTNLEGRVIRRRAALNPPPGVRSELEIWADLARRLNCPVELETEPELVFAELARASSGGLADYCGLSYDRLRDDDQPLYWPVPTADHPGTPRLFAERFHTPDSRAKMVPVEHAPLSDDLRPEAPIYLLTGRVLQHYQSGAQTRRVPDLVKASPAGFVQIHPHLADRLGLAEGDPCQVTSTRGSFTAATQISSLLRPDTVFAPFHFSGSELANAATDDSTDPICGMPAFKACAVQVSAAPATVSLLPASTEELAP